MIAWCFSDNADNDLGKTVILSYFMCVSDCRTVSGTSQMLWLHFVRTEMKVRTRPCSPTLRSFTVSLTSLEQVGQIGNLTYFNVYLRKWHPIDHIDKCFFIAVFIYFLKDLTPSLLVYSGAFCTWSNFLTSRTEYTRR